MSRLDTYIGIPLEILDSKVQSFAVRNTNNGDFCILATHKTDPSRHVLRIKVSNLATEKQLKEEIERVNSDLTRKWVYSLGKRGKFV